jgi:two-component system, OmpR family, sensor kinase
MKMKAKSIFRTIRGKITLLYILVFGATLAASSIALYITFSHRLKADFDESIISIASSLVESIQEDGLVPEEILKDLSESYSPANDGDQILLEIYNRDHSIALKSPQLGENNLPIAMQALSGPFEGKPSFIDLKISSGGISNKTFNARVILYPDQNNESARYVFAIAVPSSKIDRILFQLQLTIIILIPFAMAIAAFGGWLLAGRAFKPVNQVISAAKELEADNLHQRLPVGLVDDEISRLSITLNDMIGRLEQSFRVQRQFTADASHELRTPLTILAGQIEVALQRNRESSEYQETLKNNLEEIHRLQKIVDSLLLLSRIDSGKLIISQTPVRLDEALLSSMEKLSGIAKGKEISIDFQLDNEGSKSTDDIIVLGDAASLQNVFLNLLDNAIKYSRPGCKLSCTLKAIGQHAEIEIIDCGEGISSEHIEHIFERFYRADHSQGKDGKSGVGLGLAIARAVVEAHGGTISLSSIHGQGTTARVVLPLAN